MKRIGEIWLALDSRRGGGIETHVLNLAVGLKKRGKKVRIIFLKDYGEHPMRAAAIQAGIAVSSIEGGCIAFFKELHRYAPLLLHTHGYKAGILGRLSAFLLRIPVVSTYHAGEPGKGRLKLYSWLDRLTCYMATPIAVSQAIATTLPIEASVLNNFVPLPHKFAYTTTNDIAFVGRLSHEKGPDTFLKLATLFPDVTFHVYGDGPMRETLEASKSRNVRFHGEVVVDSEVWSSIGLLCISSRHEGLPLVALEAMSHGVPVAAFAVGALPRLVDNENGLLVPSGNFEAMRERVTDWLSKDRSQRLSLSQHARDRIAGAYSTQQVIPDVLDIYRRSSKEFAE